MKIGQLCRFSSQMHKTAIHNHRDLPQILKQLQKKAGERENVNGIPKGKGVLLQYLDLSHPHEYEVCPH